MVRIGRETLIRAPPGIVWALLTHRASRDDWDPLFARIEGELIEGARLAVRLREGQRFRPVVTRVRIERELEWLGHLPIPGLVSGRHRFVLEPVAEGTRLGHTETFEGLLVPFLGRLLRRNAASFATFDSALKAAAEREAEGADRGSARR